MNNILFLGCYVIYSKASLLIHYHLLRSNYTSAQGLSYTLPLLPTQHSPVYEHPGKGYQEQCMTPRNVCTKIISSNHALIATHNLALQCHPHSSRETLFSAPSQVKQAYTLTPNDRLQKPRGSRPNHMIHCQRPKSVPSFLSCLDAPIPR